jgi:prephenate dehydratase
MPQQDTLRVAYLGPEASFSHQAALELFPTTGPDTGTGKATKSPQVTLYPLPSFSSIFSSIQHSTSSLSSSSTTSAPCPPTQSDSYDYDYAVIPIENSTNGSVVQVFDLLGQCGLDDNDNAALYPDLQVCAEYYLPVHHCLFVHPSQFARFSSSSPAGLRESQSPQSDPFPPISTLYTHPQVWGQCGRFLSTHFPLGIVERIDVGSTSAAASLVAREGRASAGTATIEGAVSANVTATATATTIAAISSRLAGQKHNLACLAENIEDSPGDNTTRFLVLRNSRLQPRYPAYHRTLVSRLFSSPPVPSPAATTPPTDKASTPADHQARIRHKSLITFTIPHTKPGALADALAVFKTHGFNLTSIDTRPSRRRNWQYVFFVECEEASVPADGNNVATATRAAPADIANTVSENAGDVDGLHGEGNRDNNDDGDDDLGENLRSILHGLGKYTESLRYLGRFVDQLQNGE